MMQAESLNNNHLKLYCDTAKKGDDFVGIKASSDGVEILFPIGYRIPDNDREIRRDIRQLIRVLSIYTENGGQSITYQDGTQSAADFPLAACMYVIEYFYSLGGNYYTERETVYRHSVNGTQDWPKTVRNVLPLAQTKNDSVSFIFTDFIVRDQTPNDSMLITTINRYCVYVSFQKIGWMYSDYLPKNPPSCPSKSLWLSVVMKKLASTNDDRKQRLFQSMLDILRNEDSFSFDTDFYFGTASFENVWERMIDNMFGTEDLREYQPKTMWEMDDGNRKENLPLRPDCVMQYSGEYYIIDAKYYQYGVSGNVNDLPSTESITKQILYGEHVEFKLGKDPDKIHSVFIMPGNLETDIHSKHLPTERKGEAYCIWRGKNKCYEVIVGVVLDMRYMIYNCIDRAERKMRELADLCRLRYFLTGI